MKDKLVLIASIVVGLVAFVLTNYHLREERAKLYAGARQVQIIVAKADLPAGTVLEIKDLALNRVFERAVGGNALREENLNTILGKRLRYSVRPGDPIFWSYVDIPGRGTGGLGSMVKNGLRAISIAVSGEAAVSGLVQPNDRVDLIGTFTFPSRNNPGQMENVTLTVLQDVTVLATGQQLATDETLGIPSRRGGYSAVTLEVTPREAEVLIFAQHLRGQIALSLRNREDVSYERDLPEINFEHIESKLPELNEFRQRTIRNKRGL